MQIYTYQKLLWTSALSLLIWINAYAQERNTSERATESASDNPLPGVADSLQKIVIGYGTQKQSYLTGSTSSVSVEKMSMQPAADIGNMLQGRVPGLIASGSNQPGSSAFIHVRGFNSFGSNNPLFIVDGMQTTNLNTLNPNDIESLQVLKDVSSAAIYGGRAANGVILITTKKGKPGKTTISYDGYYGISSLTHYPDVANAAELGQILWKQYEGAGVPPNHAQYGNGPEPVIPDYILADSEGGLFEGDPAVDPDLYNYNEDNFYQIVRANKEGTDWFDEITRTAPVMNHNLSASGGNERAVYNLSLGYYDEQGVLKYTFYNRYSARVNSAFNLTDHIRIGETLYGALSKDKEAGDDSEAGQWSQAYRMHPIVPVYDIKGNFAGSRAPGTGYGRNPLAQLYRSRDNINEDARFLGSIYAEADFLKAFKFRTSFGLDYNNYHNTHLRDIDPENAEGTFSSSQYTNSGHDYRWTFTNTLNYTKDFGPHVFNVLLGTESIEAGSENTGSFEDYSPSPVDKRFFGTDSVQRNYSSSSFRTSLSSFFGRLNYSFSDKYLLNVTLRRDGSSKFVKTTRYDYFPSVSAGWRISQEAFMQGIPWLNELKLRAGYGVVGNSEMSAYSFYDITGYGTEKRINTVSEWEKVAGINGGIDFTVFGGKLEMSLDVYDKRTLYPLVPVSLPTVGGFSTTRYINVDNTHIQNKGFDFSLTHSGTTAGRALSYTLNMFFTQYKNKVVGESVDFYMNKTRQGNVSKVISGEPLGQFYGYVIDGFFQNQEEVASGPDQAEKEVGKWRWKDINEDGVINADDMTFMGSPHPKFQSAFNVDLAYKNFDLNMFFFWNYGNQIYNNVKWFTDFNSYQGNRSEKMLIDSWSPGYRDASLPRLDINDNYSNSRPHNYFVEPGSYFRAKTMQLGYTLPDKMLSNYGISNLRVYLQAQNLFTITNYTGPDPDLLSVGRDGQDLGIDHGRVPTPLQMLGGLSLDF